MKKYIIYFLACIVLLMCVILVYKNQRQITPPTTVPHTYPELTVKEINIDGLPEPIWFVKTKNPTVSVSIIFRNEGSRNFRELAGISPFTVNLLFEGAGKRNVTELTDELKYNNIDLGVGISEDDSYVNIYTVSKNFSLAIELAIDILTQAHFPDKKIQTAKQFKLVSIEQSNFSPIALANEELGSCIYGESHPYYISKEESKAAVPKYDRQSILAVYEQLFCPKNALITIAGNISEEEIKNKLTELVTALNKKKGNSFPTVEQNIDLKESGVIKYIDFDSSQSVVLFALPGLHTKDKRIYAARIANMIFSDGFNSRLFRNIRNEHGLVYGINAYLQEHDMLSFLSGRASTDQDNIEKLIVKVNDTFEEFSSKGITQQELDDCKDSISSSLNLCSARQIVSYLTTLRIDNWHHKQIKEARDIVYKLTVDDINQVIKDLYNPKNIVFVITRKPAPKNS